MTFEIDPPDEPCPDCGSTHHRACEPVSEPQDRERAEFETWAISCNLLSECGRIPVEHLTGIAWNAWQAARREERKRTLEECLAIVRDQASKTVDYPVELAIENRINARLAALKGDV